MQLKKLSTNFLGQNCIFHKTIDSTQKEAWRLLEKQEKNGTLIIANQQTNGIGTHGRTWYTEDSNDIAFSFFINTDCDIKKLENITIIIAEILVSIFKEKYNINLKIKQPNDIIFQGKKIAGILVQTKVIGEKVKSIVIGIGINTNSEKFKEEISEIATSIKKEFKIEVDNIEIISEFCNRFEEELKRRKVLQIK